MRQQRDRANPTSPAFHFHRLKAALAVQKRHFQEFCLSLPCTMRHLYCVAYSERHASKALLDAIRRELGNDAWAFCTGTVDVLRDTTPTVEAQP